MQLINKCKICCWLALFVFVSACENGIIGSGENPTPKPEPTKQGIAQKGPFEIGSNITIVTRPAPDFSETSTVQLQTLDDIGTFEFEFKTDTLYDITVSGRHLNENTGELSSELIVLKSTYYHAQDNPAFVSINILTHIIHSRINYLMSMVGLHPREATVQASQELLDGLTSVIFAEHLKYFNFSNMTVYNFVDSDPDANAILLFISAAFYKQSEMFNNSRPLSEMLAILAADLEKDGVIDGRNEPETTPTPEPTNTDGAVYISSLDFAARLLNPETIIKNLSNHSLNKIGVALPVPDISFLLDTDADGLSNDIDADDDGDGIADVVDENPYQFEIFPVAQSFTVNQDSSIKLDLIFNTPEDATVNQLFVGYNPVTEHGALSGAYPNISYTPNPGFVGVDTFSYQVSCLTCLAISTGIYTSEATTVTINVTSP